MKINLLNHISEERKISEFMLFLERSGIFAGGTDLEEIEDNNISDGVNVLEAIIAGKGDDLSQDQIELAAKSWKYLRNLLNDSAEGLKEQIQINKMISAGTKKEDEINLSVD